MICTLKVKLSSVLCKMMICMTRKGDLMLITFLNCLVLLFNRKYITKSNPGLNVWTDFMTNSWGLILAFILIPVFFICLLECTERINVQRNGEKADKFEWGFIGFLWTAIAGGFNALILSTDEHITLYLILGMIVSLIVTAVEIIIFCKDAVTEYDSILMGIIRGIGFEMYLAFWAVAVWVMLAFGFLMLMLCLTPVAFVLIPFIFDES